MVVYPVKGRVHVAVVRDDGQTLSASSPARTTESPVTHTLTLTAPIPTDGKGYGHTDLAHNYHAVLQLEPGAELHVLGGGVERVD
jgi:hypothetical protein